MPELILKKLFEDYREGEQDPLKGGLLVSRLIDDDLNTTWVYDQFNDLAKKMRVSGDTVTFLDDLQRFGFEGALDFNDKKLSSIAYVLRHRIGIPISLAMVIIGIGNVLGFRIKGINFPGHFLLKLNDLLIDPHGLKAVQVGTETMLNNQRCFIDPNYLVEINGVKIVSRMLNNLRFIAIKENDFNKAIEYCSYQILIENVNFQLYIERASLFLNSGDKEGALKDLERAIIDAPTDAVRSRLIINRDKITRKNHIVH
ncbi:MAG: hypothetical protein CBC29_08685 [Methylococcaceae bacterium TMED69]|nr:MAG: hypothetical protein CBC29_08685 [Methylococcaceae bacterium TMED69]